MDETSEKAIKRIYEAFGSNPEQEAIAKVGLKWVMTLLQKNADYGSTVFSSPRLAPECASDTAIRVRMSDKVERLSHILSHPYNPIEVDESISDTVQDLGAYCLLWLVGKSMSVKPDQP